LFCFAVLGLNSGPTPSVTPPVLFCDGFFWDGGLSSMELLAQAGFETWSSWSLPPE
jgi:hypothetical protein